MTDFYWARGHINCLILYKVGIFLKDNDKKICWFIHLFCFSFVTISREQVALHILPNCPEVKKLYFNLQVCSPSGELLTDKSCKRHVYLHEKRDGTVYALVHYIKCTDCPCLAEKNICNNMEACSNFLPTSQKLDNCMPQQSSQCVPGPITTPALQVSTLSCSPKPGDIFLYQGNKDQETYGGWKFGGQQ